MSPICGKVTVLLCFRFFHAFEVMKSVFDGEINGLYATNLRF